jgi:myo-inositol catabolism protein IolC
MSTAKNIRELYVMPFDHRASFQEKLFGIRGRKPTAAETAEIASYKEIIYQGFLKAVATGIPREQTVILTDEQFGSQVLAEAHAAGFTTACPVEKSGQDEFDFEYGKEFGAHIEKINPTFVKVLVRYNPEGEMGINRTQRERLRLLSNYCRTNLHEFLFELIVPATPRQLAQVGQDTHRYDRELRPALMARAIAELQNGGIEPNIWKVEGLDTIDNCKKIVAVARNIPAREDVGVIVLGRGAGDDQVRHWLKTAAKVPGFVGFAVGRTIFWEPLKALHEKRQNREAAIEQIAQNYKSYCDLWMDARQASSVGSREKPTSQSL